MQLVMELDQWNEAGAAGMPGNAPRNCHPAQQGDHLSLYSFFLFFFPVSQEHVNYSMSQQAAVEPVLLEQGIG